jgi:hypothetical protein
MTRVVSRIDHIVIEAGDEQAVFDFFHITLGLPIAWPMAQWGPIHEGGINLGNCNIGCNHKLDPNAPDEPRIAAVAFEPHGGIDRALAAMDDLGLDHTPPMPSGPIDGAPEPWKAGWTNALILNPTPISFLCEYNHDANARRRAEAEAFAAHPNPLGICGLRAIGLDTSDMDGWRALTRGVADDVSIICDATGRDAYYGLSFYVESLDGATAEAERLGIVGGSSAAHLDLRFDGLNLIQLHER